MQGYLQYTQGTQTDRLSKGYTISLKEHSATEDIFGTHKMFYLFLSLMSAGPASQVS